MVSKESYFIGLEKENKQLKSRLKIKNYILVLFIVFYIIMLATTMNKHMKWYNKGRDDAYEEVKHRMEKLKMELY